MNRIVFLLPVFLAFFAGSSAFTVISGRYELVKCENFEAFLDAVGASEAKKDWIPGSTVIVDIWENGDNNFTVTIRCPKKTTQFSFQLGVEKTVDLGEEHPPIKVITTRHGDVLNQVVTVGPHQIQVTREFTSTEQRATFRIGNVVATQWFRKHWERSR